MRRYLVVLLPVVLALAPARAGEAPPDFDQLLQAGQQWVEENLDADALAVLGVEVGAFSQFVRELEQRLAGEYVLDLAALQPAVDRWLPVLEAHAETGPYAAWLRGQLSDFAVARELQRTAPTNAPAWKPTAAQQRAAWQRQLQREPWPRAATNWVPQLKPRFTNSGAPAELVWLAEVESGFNATARSPAGAVGMFQFMPATARRFGLEVSWLRDDRKNPDRSARAAAAYLKLLHAQFKDWRLALAAYNCGEGRVAGLIKRHQARSFDALAPHLPAETQMYVPKFEATLLKREGVRLAKLPAPAKPAK